MSTRNEGTGGFTEPAAHGSKEILEQDHSRLAPPGLEQGGDIAARPEDSGAGRAPSGGAAQTGTGLPGLASFTTLSSYTPTTQTGAGEQPADHGETQLDYGERNGAERPAHYDPAPEYTESGGLTPSYAPVDEQNQQGAIHEEPRLPEPRFEEAQFEEPRISEPRFEEPRFDEPRYEEPRYEEPRSAEPGDMEPRFEPPVFAEPARAEPAFEEPRLDETRYAEPHAEEPRFEQPRYEEPRFEQPAFEAPNYDEPNFEPSPAYEAMLGARSAEPVHPPEPVRHPEPDLASAYESDASFEGGFESGPADPHMSNLGGVSTEDLQRVLSGEAGDYPTSYGREAQADFSAYPEQEPTAYSDHEPTAYSDHEPAVYPDQENAAYADQDQATYSDYDASEPAYPATDDAPYDQSAAQGTGIQQFEARYDKHPEISLAGYEGASEAAPDEAERPFFHEKEQSDADFLGEERTALVAGEETGRKGRKLLMVACGLVGALALGGALAFAYKKSGTLLTSSDTAPIIEADGRPVKVAPENPGGKDFPHKNKLIYDRLSGEQRTETEKLVSRQEDVVDQAARALAARKQAEADGGAPASNRVASAPSGEPQAAPDADAQRDRSFAAPAGTESDADAQPAGGPRKVKTLVVRPDGTIVRQAPPAAAPAAEAPPSETVAATPEPAPAKPRVAAAPVTRAEPAPPAPEKTRVAAVSPADIAPPPTRKPKPPATAAARPAPQPPASPATPATAAGGNFVVQVGARKSQTAALAGFADLQQKYPSILSGYRPIIQKADLGRKGVWYRLRIGPLATKTAAAGLCKKLRSAGMRNCLVNTQ